MGEQSLTQAVIPSAAVAPTNRITATDFAEWLTIAEMATDKKLVKLAGIPSHLTPTHLRICRYVIDQRFPGTPFAKPDLHKLARYLARYGDDRSPERREINRIAAAGMWSIEDPTSFPVGSIRFVRPSWADLLLETKRASDQARSRLPRQTLLFEPASDQSCPKSEASFVVEDVAVTLNVPAADQSCPKAERPEAAREGFQYLLWFWSFQKPAGSADKFGVIHAPSLYLSDRQKLVAMMLLAHADIATGFTWVTAKGIAGRIKPLWIMREAPRLNHIYQDLAALKKWRFIKRAWAMTEYGLRHGFYLLDPSCWLGPDREPECPDINPGTSPAGVPNDSPAAGPGLVPHGASEHTHRTRPKTDQDRTVAAQPALAAPAGPAVAGKEWKDPLVRARKLWETAPESRMMWIGWGCRDDHAAAQRARAIRNAGGGEPDFLADEIIVMAALAALARSIEQSGVR